ncbi:MAG TPA: phosphoglycerate kinase [Pirellulales bacterium]|nr:phosphoglycerate kinase [Pirellulales bacterium]
MNADRFIRSFKEIGIDDGGLVGGKNASLGEMYRELTPKGIRISNGGAITAEGCRPFLKFGGLDDKSATSLRSLDTRDVKKTIREIDLTGKRVLVRVDFNVPLTNGVVSDDTRIRASVPTIQYLIDHKARVILCSHLGRPEGKPTPALSLDPVAARLSELLNRHVRLAPDCVGRAVTIAIETMVCGDTILLENLRFHPEEEADDPSFAQQLASLADLFVNDAFGSAHRAHASTVGVARYLPAMAGLLMERELDVLGHLLSNPARPFVAILGGAKISGKISLVTSLLDRVDLLLVGGGMANTFLKTAGKAMGQSLVEESKLDVARELLIRGRDKLLLPQDLVVAGGSDARAARCVIGTEDVPPGWKVMDIGPKTVAAFRERLRDARTVVWNGPMGVFEMAPFAEGTLSVARALAEIPQATTVVGGGDTIAAVKQAGVEARMTHISTGGGACLEFLEGKQLPGVVALLNR